MARRQPSNNRRYPRTARLNELLREILAEELAQMDDDRIEMITVTQVRCEADVRRAEVFFSSFVAAGSDEEAEILEALGESRYRFQAAIGRQARLKRTPELTFTPDETARSAARIEDILRDLAVDRDEDEGAGTSTEPASAHTEPDPRDREPKAAEHADPEGGQ